MRNFICWIGMKNNRLVMNAKGCIATEMIMKALNAIYVPQPKLLNGHMLVLYICLFICQSVCTFMAHFCVCDVSPKRLVII